MAVTLNLGYRPYLLTHLKYILQDNTPQYKVEPVGFLNLLSSQSKPKILRLDNSAGHQNVVQIHYKQRYTVDFTDTVASCDQLLEQARREMPIDLTSYRQIAIHIDDELIARYEDDASNMMRLGTPPTPVMNEFIDEIMNAASAILEGVNLDLMTTAVAGIGVNRRTGLNTATALNINADGNTLRLNDGLTQILSDYKINGGRGVPQVYGSGLFFNFMLQQASKTGYNGTGFDTSVQAAGLKFFHDLQAAAILGANEIVVCQPDSLQWVEYMQYTGFKAGQKPGASQFFTLPLPMQIGTEVIPVEFDVQLRYDDCPATYTDAYYGTSISVDKGYNLIISKKSGLFMIPADAYRATDPLTGNRGTLRYQITNSCDAC